MAEVLILQIVTFVYSILTGWRSCMKKALVKKIITMILLLTLIVPACFIRLDAVYGDNKQNLNDANNKKSDLQSEYDKTQKKLDELKNQSNDTEAYLAQLDSQMSSINSSLDEVNGQIEQIEIEITDTEEKLVEAEQNVDEQYDAMKLRIQYMYEHNDETYFALLLNSESMGDMLNKAEYITKISEYDRKMLEKFNETVNFITDARIKLEQDRETLVTKQGELQDKKSSLELLESTKKAEMAALKKNAQQQQDYQKKIEADMKAQDAYIASIEAQIKAEEEARKNTISNNSSNGSNSSGNNSSGQSTKYDGGAFKWPTVSTRITSPYGDMDGRTSPHQGIDIGAVNRGVSGDPIYAAADGKVVISQFSSSAGNYIMIYHGNGLYTRYLHASSLLVGVGEYVTKGQKIALMGTTGNSDGVHLHFDVRLNGSVVNPWNYLSK